ncbi:helix-turn-helix domain-containing protein [Candidatus Leptofilum sp.]|uniref:helix-turn-helix domain-containing protein n=1 Tax=Candidatus Leptofilum sp. TaxID=3241576 RepID=UPI003B5AB191
MNQCPHCHRTDSQVRNGKTVAGSQVFKCKACNRKYVPQPQPNGHPIAIRQQAIRLVLDGNSQRQAARHLGVAPQSVANWLKAYADKLPSTLPGPNEPVEVAEQDELFTFIGEKKTKSTS